MFAIVISEKGGGERRETFDRAEISVGRVQGNEVVLPKGNVSKRHARLLFRDGRFIVTDLNSTNGTYVNRRRISQATIVREGDRIYVGDFVLRIEVMDAASSQEVSSGEPKPRGALASSPEVEQRTAERSSAEQEVVDSAEPSPKVPGAPQVPSGARVPSTARDPSGPPGRRPTATARGSRPDAASPSIPAPRAAAPGRGQRGSEADAHRAALVMLVDRVSSALDEGLDESGDQFRLRVTRLVESQVAALEKEGAVTSALSKERLSRDARAELLDIGPIDAQLQDEEVSEITVVRFDHVVAMRSGRYTVVEPPFSSEASLRRAVGGLCRRSGTPLAEGERVVERALPGGARMWAAVEAVAPRGALLVIRKPRRIALSLDDLVRGGAASRAMAAFLEQCVKGRINMLVVGACDTGSLAVTSALSEAGGDARLIVVQDVDDIASANANVTTLSVAGSSSDSGELVRIAARVPGARLMVELATHEMVEATIQAIGAGADGVIALLRAPSLPRALSRLSADLGAARGGMGVAAAREWVASSFEILVEVRRMSDRRYRVTRISEITGSTDSEILTDEIYRFEIERVANGAVDGRFLTTGVVPRATGEMAGRGMRIDKALFKR